MYKGRRPLDSLFSVPPPPRPPTLQHQLVSSLLKPLRRAALISGGDARLKGGPAGLQAAVPHFLVRKECAITKVQHQSSCWLAEGSLSVEGRGLD